MGTGNVLAKSDFDAIKCPDAAVAELVDATVLGTVGATRGGSSPSSRTISVSTVWRVFCALHCSTINELRLNLS